jgi:hypothetical protein
VNGAPAKPMSGVVPSSPTSARTASMTGATCAGASSGMRATSAADRTGSATTGPTPATMSSSNSAACNGNTMSLNRIAASTP